MPFASTELAARIERAECALLREAVAAVLCIPALLVATPAGEGGVE